MYRETMSGKPKKKGHCTSCGSCLGCGKVKTSKIAELPSSLKEGCEKGYCGDQISGKSFQLLKSMVANETITGTEYPSVLSDILVLQGEMNSPLFASHGIDHAVRTTAYALELYNQGLCQDLDVRQLFWSNMLHDCGYSELDYCQVKDATEKNQKVIKILKQAQAVEHESNFCDCEKNRINPEKYRKMKFLHALLGKNMVKRIIKPLVYSWLKKDQERVSETKLSLASENMLYAILNHNADSDKQSEYLQREDGVLPSLTGLQNYKRPYVKATFDLGNERSQMLALMRFADNLDITRARLSPEQGSEAMLLFQRRYAEWCQKEDFDLDDRKKINHEKRNEVIKKLWVEAKSYIQVTSLVLKSNKHVRRSVETERRLLENCNKKEFTYQYGNWIIDDIDLKVMQNEIKIDVKFTETDIKELQRTQNVGIWVDQFKRLQEATRSITWGSKTLDKCILIRDKNKRGKKKEEIEYTRLEEFVQKNLGKKS